jgi:glucose-6-phosphate isomerase
MNTISIDLQSAKTFIPENQFQESLKKSLSARETLYDMTGKGKEFLGWLHLPSSISTTELEEIETVAQRIRNLADYVVVIGIGGSYLGTKAVLEALQNSFQAYQSEKTDPTILFAGHHISEDYMAELLNFLTNKRFAIVVISKSGTTTEPAIAFRLLLNEMKKTRSSDEMKNLIVAITDEKKGALRKVADLSGYSTFNIPDEVGGRFSVLTAVGLLPIAIAGFNIRSLIEGAKKMEIHLQAEANPEKNQALAYAITRNLLNQNGYLIEILANYHPKLHFITEWWKQLYGESEGKQGKGIFPAGVDFTTDLHSMGQYIQDGNRILFETVLSVENESHTVTIPSTSEDYDELNYIAGKRMSEVNKMAELGTRMAHISGNVPNLIIRLPQINEYHLGELFYFFENACAISGYMLDVNPFDQPGVEAYKKNMFHLLGK